MTENKKNILPIYLVMGNDGLKRDAFIKRLKVRLEETGDLSFNSDVFNADTASIDDIVTACKTLPFACEKRLVVVNDAEKLKKKDVEVLADYISDPSDTTVLVLISENMDSRSSIYKLVSSFAKGSIFDCSIPKGKELRSQVVHMAEKFGLKFDIRTAEKLIELIGQDTVYIDKELSRLALIFPPGSDVTVKDIEMNVSRVNEAKIWDFSDAFADRDLAACIRLRRMMPSTSSHALLSTCLTRIRELICARSVSEEYGNDPNRLADNLKKKDWQVKELFSYSAKFSDDELISALESAIDTEMKMKSGTDPDTAFMDWVIEVIRRG